VLALPIPHKSTPHDGTFFRTSVLSACENHTAAAASPEPEADVESRTVRAELVRSTQRQPPPSAFSKQQLLELVDPYRGESTGSVEEYLRFSRDPYLRGYATPDGPNLTLARTKEDYDFPSPNEAATANPEVQVTLRSLRSAIRLRLRNNERIDLDELYNVYQQLPEPRIRYIPGRLRHLLMKALGQPLKRNSKSMLRYFAVVADIKNCGMTLTAAEWNAAISFASRYVGSSTEVEVEAALKLWREMEHDARIPATDVTFNILFDVASKAGNFTLADMIYHEMESRGHRPNRYHYVSLIHYFGLKMDADGLRAAYAEMVHAGEMIDTVALNAVISGLLRSGEEASAERVYERMKESVAWKSALPVRTYSTDRAITQVLLMFARIGRRHPQLQVKFQENTPLHPDLHTYRILVNHYGIKLGDLTRVAQYIDEMKFFKIPLHGAIFLGLFKSFALHGGSSGSPWSAQRLQSILNALMNALDDNTPGLEIKTWLACWALRAFARCSTRDSVMGVYDALKERWHLGYEDEQFMIDFLAHLLR